VGIELTRAVKLLKQNDLGFGNQDLSRQGTHIEPLVSCASASQWTAFKTCPQYVTRKLIVILPTTNRLFSCPRCGTNLLKYRIEKLGRFSLDTRSEDPWDACPQCGAGFHEPVPDVANPIS
jgi:hypothetical protein